MIPVSNTLMLPYLKLLADNREWQFQGMVEALAHHFRVNSEERQRMIPSGQKVFDYHVGYCRTIFRRYGLVEQTRLGYVRITQKGIDVLARKPKQIDIMYLKMVDGY
jgi:restriction system protein